MPLWGEPENRSFLTGFGLPIEDLNSRMAMKPGLQPLALGRTAEKLAAPLVPPVRKLIEGFAGKALWSGRPMGELASVTESMGYKMRAVDQLADLMPTSRGQASLRQAADAVTGRKPWYEVALHQLTGLRTTTVDVPLARIRDIERAAKRELQDEPLIQEGEHFYVPKHIKEEDPEAAAELQEKIRAVGRLRRAAQKIRESRPEK